MLIMSQNDTKLYSISTGKKQRNKHALTHAHTKKKATMKN